MLRNDPTRTTSIRKAFERDMSSRFREVRGAVVQLVDEEDALGLEPSVPFTLAGNAQRQVWRFQTDEQKLGSFRKWLQDKVDEKVLVVDHRGQPWLSKYVESAYKKGNLRAYTDAMGKKGRRKGPDFFAGTQAEFLRAAFGQPEQLAKVKLLASRAFEELRGVTTFMAQKMNRALANGMLKGDNPKTIARTMSREIDGLTRTRALVIARTEIIHAHAEGQLDSFEALGTDVGVLAEWSTAGDDRVCQLCASLEGAIMTVKEARGLIPRHPNCRCAWIPAEDVRQKNRRRTLFRKIAKSLDEGGGARASTWAGKSLRKKRKS